MKKVAIIIGTRAEFIKTMPIMLELKKRKIPYSFIHTGQHSLKDLCEKFEIKKPDFVLTPAPSKSTKFFARHIRAAFWNLGLIFSIKRVIKKINPDYVIYHGDTMTTASASIASSKMLNPSKKYKNIHLEAGLRSGNLFEPFPEEISRIIADRFSEVLFAVSERSKNNLRRYKKSKKIILTGNTIIDSVDVSYKKALKEKIKVFSNKKFALISIHRHENIKNKKRLEKIVKILLSLNIPSYFPLYDNTKEKLIKFGLYKKLIENKNIKILEYIDYVNFIYQLKNCSLLICDGGSIQEESLVFGKPCIILRNFTERQEGLESNFQFLSKLNVKKTVYKINEYLSKDFKVKKFKNPYGNIGLSEKIVDLIQNDKNY